MFLSTGLFAQGVYNNGGKIVIGLGVTLTVGGSGGNYLNQANAGSNGALDLSGTLKLTGDLTNNVADANFLKASSTGTVIFTGSSLQTVGGATNVPVAFADLTIDNSSGVLFSQNAGVDGALNLANGLVDIGDNNFNFGTLAAISGSPSATSMIIATGAGQVQKDWNTAGSFTFPVGDNVNYSPVSLDFTQGTFSAGAQIGLNLVAAKYD